MKRIVVVTDMNPSGSGYLNISVPLFILLSKDYDIRIIGLGYAGQENNYPFSVLPCRSTDDAFAMVHNLITLAPTNPDIIIVALDIPMQISFYEKFAQYKKPYIAITPLENPPLTMSWAGQMLGMDWVFFISELGKQAALVAGLKNVDHLEIGIDSNFWRVPTPEEKQGLRKGMGIADDEYVILTVADNQERKNLWAAMCVTAELKIKGRKVKHILVTRVESQFGYKIRDLALTLDINKELVTMNRGMPKENLWSLYAMSDCFLLSSKAEGLGLPIMEAMASGLPVVATDTGAIHELLENGRGFLIPAEYEMIDVWGNETRKMMSISYATTVIDGLISKDKPEYSIPARQFIERKSWKIPAIQLGMKIEELTHVQE